MKPDRSRATNVDSSLITNSHMPIDTKSSGPCVKWYVHKVGTPNYEAKPKSTGRTISILIGDTGEFKIEFSETESFDNDLMESYILKSTGDYVIWGAGLYHRAYCTKQSTILTIRWEPKINITSCVKVQ